ncbi:MAG: rod shape-determining protein MreD [Ignavibacteriae bacterium]|nr:MAG: rod shape-determining protein MreD [Ignavibacteriota bacterium]
MIKPKINEIIIFAVLLLMLAIIQVSVIPLLAIGTITPDLVLILVVIFALKYGQFNGTIYGAIAGLTFDLISGGILGSAMFAKTISGFITGYFFNENKVDQNLSTMYLLLVVFIAATVNSFFYLLIISSEIKLTVAHLIVEQGILPGLYTALFVLPIVIFNQRNKSFG